MACFPFRKKFFSQKGFTLVEMLVVVIILGILAAMAIPQFGSSSEDASASTLKSNLSTMRAAIELYYHQHNSRYPGRYKETDGTTSTGVDAGAASTAFSAQFLQYTDKNGKANGIKTAVFKYGPYIKKLIMPQNPFIDGAAAGDVLCDLTINDVTIAVTASGNGGWKFYVLTGRLIADDNLTLSDGATKTIDF